MAHIITDLEALSLMKMAKHLVGQQIKTGLIKEDDGDDYVQELLLDVVKKQNSMEPPSDSRFETFAYLVMKRHLIDIWRKNHPQFPTPGSFTSMHMLVKNSDGETTEFGNLLTGDEADPECDQAKERRLLLKFDVCAFLDSLPEDERLFCEALLMGRVQRDIAAERNRSRITIRRKILAIRKKMIDAGLDQYLEKKSKKS